MPTVLSGIVESWGEKLFVAAFVYVLLVLAIAVPVSPQNPELNKLVIPGTYNILRQTMSTWEKISGAVFSGNSISVLANLFNLISSSSKAVLTILGNIAVAYILLGFVVSGFLPGPLTVIKVLIWVGAFGANVILVLYLFSKVWSVARTLLGSLVPISLGV